MLRFWGKVEMPRNRKECWPWQGCRNGKGYGKAAVNRRMEYAHRVAWEIACGPVPDGLLVCHRCDNPRCVRPGHLFVGTQSDNIRDMWAKGRGRLNPPRGEQHGRAKLALRQVVEIRDRHSRGEPARALAREFGVDKSTVQDLLKGVTWRTALLDNPPPPPVYPPLPPVTAPDPAPPKKKPATRKKK